MRSGARIPNRENHWFIGLSLLKYNVFVLHVIYGIYIQKLHVYSPRAKGLAHKNWTQRNPTSSRVLRHQYQNQQKSEIHRITQSNHSRTKTTRPIYVRTCWRAVPLRPAPWWALRRPTRLSRWTQDQLVFWVCRAMTGEAKWIVC